MGGRVRQPAAVAGVGILIFVFLVSVGFFLGSPAGSRTGAIAIGVASSLLASFAFSMFDGLLMGSRRLELDRQIECATDLARGLSLVQEAERHQIETVKPKGDYDREEWLAILEGAKCSLTMIGHALDKWCEEEIEEVFCKAIRRVVHNGGEVRLLMLAEGADRVSKLRDKGYTKRIQRTLRVLVALNGELRGPGRLSVYHLGDELDMPYMAVVNDSTMITAPYPATAQSSNGMPTVRLACDSEIAQHFQADIDVLLEGQVTAAKL
jgi:hypothetical protein